MYKCNIIYQKCNLCVLKYKISRRTQTYSYQNNRHWIMSNYTAIKPGLASDQ